LSRKILFDHQKLAELRADVVLCKAAADQYKNTLEDMRQTENDVKANMQALFKEADDVMVAAAAELVANIVLSVPYDINTQSRHTEHVGAYLEKKGHRHWNPNNFTKKFCGEECCNDGYNCKKFPFTPMSATRLSTIAGNHRIAGTANSPTNGAMSAKRLSCLPSSKMANSAKGRRRRRSWLNP